MWPMRYCLLTLGIAPSAVSSILEPWWELQIEWGRHWEKGTGSLQFSTPNSQGIRSHPRLITDVHKYICSRVNVFYLETNCSTFMKGRKGKDQKPNCCWLTWWANWQTTHLCPTGPMMSPELSPGIYRSCHLLPPQQNSTQCPSAFT